MNEFLSQFYGTTKTAAEIKQTEEEQKVAAAAEQELRILFAKTAAAEGIDLAATPKEKVAEYWTNFTQNVAAQIQKEAAAAAAAAPAAPAQATDAEKLAAAEQELLMAKQAQADFERADASGRVMAHAYVHELRKIAEALEKEGKANPFANFGKSVSHAAGAASKAVGHAADKASDAARDAAHAGKKKFKEMGKVVGKHKKELAAGAAGAAAGAAGGYAAGKTASALDELGAEQALKLAADANFDPEVIGERLDAIFESGAIAPSTKIASAMNTEQAVHVRALELLEQCGCNVDWTA